MAVLHEQMRGMEEQPEGDSSQHRPRYPRGYRFERGFSSWGLPLPLAYAAWVLLVILFQVHTGSLSTAELAGLLTAGGFFFSVTVTLVIAAVRLLFRQLCKGVAALLLFLFDCPNPWNTRAK